MHEDNQAKLYRITAYFVEGKQDTQKVGMRVRMLADCSLCPQDEVCEPDAERDGKS